jgi:hypothetical protein
MAQRPAKRVYVIRHKADEVALLNDLKNLAAKNGEA